MCSPDMCGYEDTPEFYGPKPCEPGDAPVEIASVALFSEPVVEITVWATRTADGWKYSATDTRGHEHRLQVVASRTPLRVENMVRLLTTARNVTTGDIGMTTPLLEFAYERELALNPDAAEALEEAADDFCVQSSDYPILNEYFSEECHQWHEQRSAELCMPATSPDRAVPSDLLWRDLESLAEFRHACPEARLGAAADDADDDGAVIVTEPADEGPHGEAWIIEPRDLAVRATRALQAAAECELRGDYERAVRFHRIGLRCEPVETAVCHRLAHGLGRSLLLLGRADEAVACFALALRHAPDAADSFKLRGLALEALGRFDEAALAYIHAMRCDRCVPYALGHLQRMSERHADALRERLPEIAAAIEKYDLFMGNGFEGPAGDDAHDGEVM